MQATIDLKNVIDQIISSYETKVQSVSDIVDTAFDTTYLALGDFRECLTDAKEERNKINLQLREILAKNEHLRKKDFNSMMQDILRAQEEREEEIKKLLRDYFNEQKSGAQTLRASLNEFRTSLAKGEFQKIKEFKRKVKDTLLKQDRSKQEITAKLVGYQKQQHFLSSKPMELLAKGTKLRIKDFKTMLKEFNTLKEERLTFHKKRKEDVAQMLKNFKEERKKSVSVGAVNIDGKGGKIVEIIANKKNDNKRKV